ncbi:hypothetical protein [Bathymodiolus platifrons methanotrophic gill symbiont]|uniref:hypothetical protein n=1 Tax=Bathymodiolus platifrons methanotrophic gill symbiont TaxID=113268 RepID=UPI001C8D6217|nr:hypothetical protein [Bathymodiolus platifrons methanotrophic gill symbiont]
MNSESLFSMALGLQSPWKVEEIIFSNDNILEQNELHRGVPTFAKAHFGRPSPSSRQKLNGTD